MGKPKVTYTTYVEEFGDSVSLDAFTECLHAATSVVTDLCWPNEPTTDAQSDAWVLAVCAAIQADAMSGCSHGVADIGGGSFTLGKFSMSNGSSNGSGSAVLDAMRDAARRELVGSGLLCRVIM